VVYFLQATDGTGPVKIGTSVDVPARVKALESHYRRPLAVLATMPGGRDEERAIHERFSHLRFGRTEQFRPEADLLAFIGRPLFVNACPVVEPMEDRDTRKPIALVVRGSPEYKAWLVAAAAYSRMSVSRFVDEALTLAAKQQGFPEKPPRR
jgi:hypothetical protein